MRIEVDLTEVTEAFGDETSYFGGTAVVGSARRSMDGTNDRGDNWVDFVAEELLKQAGLGEDNDELNLWGRVGEEMGTGCKYVVEIVGDDLTITEDVSSLEIARVGSHSILYVADGAIFQIGPFGSEAGAMEAAKECLKVQHVYHLTPDHQLIKLSAGDLGLEVEGGQEEVG